MAAEIALICEAKMKKILCFLVAAVMLLALCVSASADSKLDGSVRYDVTVSEDGKTAKMVVTLSGYDDANSIMIVPEFDSDNLTLKRGRWLVEGVLSVNWNAEYGDAVIAFSDATDVNAAVFEMTFTVVGDVKALDNVNCDIIVKTVENQQEPAPETDAPGTTAPEPSAPKNEYVETAVSTPEETEPEETESKETEPTVIQTPETESAVIETFLPETEPEATEPSESEEEITDVQETEAEATEPEESEQEETKPSASYPNYGDYVTQSDYEKNKSNNNLVPILIVAGIAVVGACVAVVIITRKKSK